MPKWKFLSIIVLLLIMSGCNLPAPASLTPTVDIVATQVSAILTTQPTALPLPTDTPAPSPTETLPPTIPPLPTLTDTPLSTP